jgi:AcrR family transcriptional regulator
MAPTRTTRTRLSAAQRREEIMAVAMPEFASTGYFGTSTETIARKAGISHAYLFRLFGTKKELFLACAALTCERTKATFRAAAERWQAERHEPTVLAAMGDAYRRMLEDRQLLQLQMQVWAACSDPDIGAAARAQYGEVVLEVERLSGAGPEALNPFVAQGMLLNVVAALGLDDLAATHLWVRHLLPHHDHPPLEET